MLGLRLAAGVPLGVARGVVRGVLFRLWPKKRFCWLYLRSPAPGRALLVPVTFASDVAKAFALEAARRASWVAMEPKNS